MTDYLNYTTANTTNMTGALTYAASTLNTATGMDVFFPMLTIGCFMGALFVANKYGFERSVLFASFFTMVFALMFVAIGLLNPVWLLLSIILLGFSLSLGW